MVKFTTLLLSAFLLVLPQSRASEPLAQAPEVVKTDDGVSLKGMWAFPANQIPKAVLVILPGSGNVGMDGDVSSPVIGKGYQNKPALLSLQIAEVLAQKGFATLRYDKRGFEKKEELAHQTAPYLLKDAKAALALASARYKGLKVGFIGFSEGGQIALWAATESPVDALFLLAPPSRHIDTLFEYQFLTWPVAVVSRLDKNQDGKITWDEMSALGENGKLPTLGMDGGGLPWKEVFEKTDRDNDRALSIEHELIPMYRDNFKFVMQVMPTLPGFGDWYKAIRAVPSFDELAGKIYAPVYLYQAKEDSQMSWRWIANSRKSFTNADNGAKLRLFEGLGHCFAPLEGAVGEVKTSGPYSNALLDALAADAAEAFPAPTQR